MAKGSPQTQPRNTQARRRLKYGVNVAIAVLAALALVVLINWLGFRKFQRWDLSSDHRYTLSPQTQRVMGRLDQEHEIVTLFSVRDSNDAVRNQLESIKDLVDEYGRRSAQISVRHIDPLYDVAASDRFRRRITDLYEQEIAPVREAIESTRADVQQIAQIMQSLQEPIAAAKNHDQLENADLKNDLDEQHKLIARYNPEQLEQNIEKSLQGPLPDYTAAHSQLLDHIEPGLLNELVELCRSAPNRYGTPATVQNDLLGLIQRLQNAQRIAQRALQTLNYVSPPSQYSNVRQQLLDSQVLAVVGPDRVALLEKRLLYRQVLQTSGQQQEPSILSFGEEKITGALISMQIEQPPMVVFVQPGASPIGDGGDYSAAAQRLRHVSFDVHEWNPAANQSAPQPASGQQAIWIVVAPHANQAAAVSDQMKQIMDHVSQRMNAGDSVLLLQKFGVSMRPGRPAPVHRMLQAWGITSQSDQLILREDPRPNSPAPLRDQTVTEWSDQFVVTRAISGLPAQFALCTPLQIDDAAKPNVTHWPLVTLRHDRMWTVDLSSIETTSDGKPRWDLLEFNESQSADTFHIGIAAQRNEARLVVVSSQAWAINPVFEASAQLPGNGELFMNSVFWLAHQEKLIAASPRTQDVPRIDEMSDRTLAMYRWGLLAGMPAMVLFIGLGVWAVRRRG